MSTASPEKPHVRNPLEDTEGLSPEDSTEATELYSNFENSLAAMHANRRKWRKHGPTKMGAELLRIGEFWGHISDIKKPKKAGRHALKAHEGQYEAQAVKDAIAEGYETNFGTNPDVKVGLTDRIDNLKTRYSQRQRRIDRRDSWSSPDR